jgi:hypothetical protein
VRIAYLILAHHRPRQLARLVDRLSGPETRFFVHFDASAADAAFDEGAAILAGRGDVEFVPRIVCAWGDMSLVDAAMETVKAALASGFRFDVAVLLSGQDYPIKSNDRIRAWFARHRGRPVMHVWRLPSVRWANELDGRERYDIGTSSWAGASCRSWDRAASGTRSRTGCGTASLRPSR